MGRQRLNAKDLAEASDVPYGTLRRYLDATRHIDVAVLGQVATALGVSVATMVALAQQRVDFAFPSADGIRLDPDALSREPGTREAAEAEARRVAEVAARRIADAEAAEAAAEAKDESPTG